MISLTCFCSSQARAIMPMRLGPISGTSCSRSGWFSMTSRVSVPKRATMRSARRGPMPLHQPRAQVAADAGHGGRQRLLADLHLELQAVLWMVAPVPAELQVLARRQLGQVADDGHQAFTVKPRRPAALGAQAQDAVPVLRVVVGEALDRAGQCIHD